MSTSIGLRLVHIRGPESQAAFAPRVGLHKNTLGKYERGDREIGAEALRRYVDLGWSANWVLTGVGPERLDGPASGEDADLVASDSQPVRQDALKIAVTLAQQALDGRTLPPAEYGELVMLIYEALVNGLPSAQVLAFARPAARGLQGGAKDESGPSMGGAGGETASGR